MPNCPYCKNEYFHKQKCLTVNRAAVKKLKDNADYWNKQRNVAEKYLKLIAKSLYDIAVIRSPK